MRFALTSVLVTVALSTGCRSTADDLDEDGYDVLSDCNDDDASVHPGATELCNGVDDNCSGAVDEDATDATTWYADADGDGVGSNAAGTVACAAPEGHVDTSGDCDDSNAAINPSASDDCAIDIDFNCDGSIGYVDSDDDGWAACEECNDGDASISPSAIEICDGVDNDCDSETDEAGAVGATDWYADTDNDGFGDASAATSACDQPTGTVTNDTDCDDSASAVFPGADELCNGADDNCNSVIDEDATDAPTWFADSDGDGAGGTTFSVDACEAPDGYVATSTDCDDLDAATYPGATEICDDVDNDCDSSTPTLDPTTYYLDADGDGYGISVTTTDCVQPSGWAPLTGDCDDADAATNPGTFDYPSNGIDDDCSGGDYEPLVYSIDRVDGSVWAVDRSSGALVWTGNMGTESIDIARGPDGSLYAVRYGNTGIAKGSADGQTWQVLDDGGLGSAHGLFYDHDNDVLIATAAADVVEIDPNTGATTSLVSGIGGLAIDAIRMTGDERIWITTRTVPALMTYTPSTGSLEEFMPLPWGPNLITPSQDGGLYLSAVDGIMHVDLRAGVVTTWPTAGISSYGSCADPLGFDNLIVSDHSTALYAFDTGTGAFPTLNDTLGTTWGCTTDRDPDHDQDGFVAIELGGDDCDDLDPSINPGAVDDTVDGIDWNCDFNDLTDADGDGTASQASGGKDCNDADASIFYGDGATCGLPESCLDLHDNNSIWARYDGAYTIDPDGAGGEDPFDVYCDMGNGGWTLAAKVHKYHSGASTDEPNDWFSQLRDEASLTDGLVYADRDPGQASHGAARLGPLGDVSGLSKFVFIAEDDDNQRVEYFKALAPDWTDWMSDTAHATTQVCTDEAMSQNCSEGDILGGAGLVTSFDGMTMSIVGYSGGVWHMRQNNDDAPQYSALCSSTGNADGNAWNDDAIDGHWGNGMEIWVK